MKNKCCRFKWSRARSHHVLFSCSTGLWWCMPVSETVRHRQGGTCTSCGTSCRRKLTCGKSQLKAATCAVARRSFWLIGTRWHCMFGTVPSHLLTLLREQRKLDFVLKRGAFILLSHCRVNMIG